MENRERSALDGQTTYRLLKKMSHGEQYTKLTLQDDLQPLNYRVTVTLLHVAILLLGVVGNILLVVAVRRTRSLHTSTYCYLVSLAFADLLVLLSAVPDQIIAHHIGNRWISGQVGCSVMIFVNFLGINAGSISILAFTVDRYIAACRPLLILKVCNWQFARKVSWGLWIFALIYCAPWLGLTLVKPYPMHPGQEICDFRLSREQYIYLFVTDLIIFYIVPLIFAAIIYLKLGLILRRSMKSFEQNMIVNEHVELAELRAPRSVDAIVSAEKLTSPMVDTDVPEMWVEAPKNRLAKLVRSRTRLIRIACGLYVSFAASPEETVKQAVRTVGSADFGQCWYRVEVATIPRCPCEGLPETYYDQRWTRALRASFETEPAVFRMLVLIVALFAITWLPYRGLLVYNCFAQEAWLNVYYLMFAKTCVYINCAINPYLYNVMSRRFRFALYQVLVCRSGNRDGRHSK